MFNETIFYALRKLIHAIYKYFSAVNIKNFIRKKKLMFFNIFAQNIDCGYNLCFGSKHNLCFGSKLRKIGILLQTQVKLYKSGVQGGYLLRGHVFVMCEECQFTAIRALYIVMVL